MQAPLPESPLAAEPVADRFATPPSADTDSSASLRCGVCCHSTLETYVRVSGDDWTRLGSDAERHAHFIGHRAYLRMRDGRCSALAAQIDSATGATLHVCTIYERRPQICRDLARGSPACEAERLLKAARVAPQRAL